MTHNTEPLIDLRVEDGHLRGGIFLESQLTNVEVLFDLESEGGTQELDDFKDIVSSYRTFIIELLAETKLSILKERISKEITDASYSQSDSNARKEDYQELQEDLTIIKISFYREDMVLNFVAEKVYKDAHIYCQLDKDWVVDDIHMG
ncbi:MAG: hypothetical protein AB8B56_13270 [Crocinitomicaceae bacterium]